VRQQQIDQRQVRSTNENRRTIKGENLVVDMLIQLGILLEKLTRASDIPIVDGDPERFQR
jgi:hypothetical protein